MSRKLIVIWTLVLIAGCTENPQSLGAGIKSDQQAFQGTGMAFAVPGWKQGDKLQWEQHLKVRAQNQNDYNKVN